MKIIKDEIVKNRIISDNVMITFKDIGKKYIVHHEKPTLAENISRLLKLQKHEEFWAIRNINLRIKQGEKVGLYGRNGSGKTTILKIIAGICTPTEGVVKTKGRIISLIDLEAGFHPDLSGQNNIFLNGLVIGMSKTEIRSRFEKIVKFAGIGNFITAPLYTYSSGMKLRLGFSIAIHANPDILLLDEVMNMGDSEFREKSNKALKYLFKTNTTAIFVSQWLSYLKENTDRIIYLS